MQNIKKKKKFCAFFTTIKTGIFRINLQPSELFKVFFPIFVKVFLGGFSNLKYFTLGLNHVDNPSFQPQGKPSFFFFLFFFLDFFVKNAKC
jgi:hypothetical protein